MVMPSLDFDEPRLAAAVERLPANEVDQLSFGAIHLDPDGRVVSFNDAERRLSGYSAPPIGRTFFTDIAPCMNNRDFRGRIEHALAAGKLDIAFSHIGDFEDRTRSLDVRIQSAAGGGFWIFLRREP